MTDRRAFLKMLGLTTAGVAVGGTSYFFAPPGGWSNPWNGAKLVGTKLTTQPLTYAMMNEILQMDYQDIVRDVLNSSVVLSRQKMKMLYGIGVPTVYWERHGGKNLYSRKPGLHQRTDGGEAYKAALPVGDREGRTHAGDYPWRGARRRSDG